MSYVSNHSNYLDNKIYVYSIQPIHTMGSFLGSWLISYVVGLEWNTRFATAISHKNTGFWIIVAITLTVLQMGEGFLWQSFGYYDEATSQLKITDMMSSLAVIAMTMRRRKNYKSAISDQNPLVKLDNLSFGIYLSHLVIIQIAFRFLPNPNILSGFAYGLCTITASAFLCVALVAQILPKRIREWIGFV